jgi:hypothetical protein
MRCKGLVGQGCGEIKQCEKKRGTKHLSVITKVKSYEVYVLSFLPIGIEWWSLTKEQMQMLECVQTSFLGSIRCGQIARLSHKCAF